MTTFNQGEASYLNDGAGIFSSTVEKIAYKYLASHHPRPLTYDMHWFDSHTVVPAAAVLFVIYLLSKWFNATTHQVRYPLDILVRGSLILRYSLGTYLPLVHLELSRPT